MKEEWKDVVGYEGRYKVSNLGRVKSLPNKVRKTELVLKGHANVKSGHIYVNLTDLHEDKWRQKLLMVHTLVLTAFIGTCPENHEGCHGDGDPTNNALTNLRWGTRASNMADRKTHGTDNSGERNGMAKLDELTVKTIKLRLSKGERVNVLAREFCVTHGSIGHIKSGRQWSHV